MEKLYIKNKVKKYIQLIILILTPIIVYMIPIDYVELNPIACVFRKFLNIECIGCGITRATINFIHFKFEKAISYNALVVIVVPMIIIQYLKKLYKIIKSLY